MKLLLTGAFQYSQEQLNTIYALGYEVTFVQDEQVSLDIDISEFEVVVCNSLFLYNDIKKFKNLKFIQLTSVGLDRVPFDYIKESGIKLFNAKDVYSVPIAEWVVLKILEIYKKSKQFYKNQAEHKWEKQRDLLELTDKTVSIIGFGRVGQEIAKRLKGFGVHIIGVGRRKIESSLLDEYYLISDIDDVLIKSDIVILTLPLTEETRYLINEDKIKKMKDNCVMVNVSRGQVINEVKMIKALQDGKFLGVALDVFEEEPLAQDNPLWNFENVIVTPHNSFASNRNNDRLWNVIINNISKFKEGKNV